MSILRNDIFAKIIYRSDIKSVQVTWGNFDPEAHRDVFDEILELIQSRPTFTYISDIRHQVMLSPVSRRWMETELLPIAIRSGLKKVAVIVEESLYKQFFKEVSTKNQNPSQFLEFRYLYSLEEAHQWATQVCQYYEGTTSMVS